MNKVSWSGAAPSAVACPLVLHPRKRVRLPGSAWNSHACVRERRKERHGKRETNLVVLARSTRGTLPQSASGIRCPALRARSLCLRRLKDGWQANRDFLSGQAHTFQALGFGMTGAGPASSAATSAVPMASTATDTHTAGAIPLRRCGKKKTPAGLATHSAKNTDFDELRGPLVGRHDM